MKKAIILVSILILAASISLAAVPLKINFQGVLKDSAGNVINNPSLSIVFSIYSGATGGSAIWTETQSVSVEAGLYNVQMGGVTAIPADGSVFDGSTRYLGITVGTDTEMTPRLPMVSVPYAFLAQAAVTAGTAATATTASSATTAESATRLGSYLPAQTGSGSFVPVTSGGKLDSSVVPSGMTFTTTGTAPATRAENSSTYANAAALTGVITSTTPGDWSVGVRGINNGTSGGSLIGVWGSQAGGGYGVYGTSESGVGVYGYSPSGYGVQGDGSSYGGYFSSHLNSGSGVGGYGANYGGHFDAVGDTGRAVYGEAGSPIGPYGTSNYGGYFVSNGTSGTGVYATGVTGVSAEGSTGYGVYATGVTGVAGLGSNCGGYFGTSSDAGYGVYGDASSTTGSNYGVYGITASSGGKGVSGAATNGSGTNFGVYGQTNSTAGYGVYGDSTNTSGTNYGVYGRTNSPAGYGVYAKGKTDANVAAYIESVLQLKPIVSAPGSPTEGMIYYDSVARKLKVYTTVWETITSAP
jgi:hypothetical protein